MAEKEKTESEGKKPKKHLHSIRTERVTDEKGKTTGYVSHHTYKAHHSDHHTEPEKPMATHDTAEEAGEHVQDQMGAAEGAGGAAPAAGDPAAAAGAAPAGGDDAGAAEAPGM